VKVSSGALILAIALLAAAPLQADTTSAPAAVTTRAPAASTHNYSFAPPSVTSATVLMARAFRPKPETCENLAPGSLPVLAPAPVNQTGCMMSPFVYNKWARCPVFPAAPVIPLGISSKSAPPPQQQTSFVVGDTIDGIQTGVSLITGHVQLDQGDRRVTTDKMTYDSNTGIAVMDKGLNYYSPRMELSSPSGIYDTSDGTGTFQASVFQMPLRNGRGTASVFNSLDDDHSQLYEVQYTTCPPGHDDWLLTAPDLYMDTVDNLGEGHDITIHFFGVPIFWAPYLNFPITDARKSGFIGSTFSWDVLNGFEISAPYYLNLAENYDLMLFPRVITKRGLENGAEFRWLDEYNQGFLFGDYLPHDQVADRERSEFMFHNATHFNEFNSLDSLYQWVSDDRFFRDLGSDIAIPSNSLLGRHLQYTYDDEADWMFMSQLEDFQVIAPFIPRPLFSYRRLPQVVVNWSNNTDFTGPQYDMYAEFVHFQRDLRIGTKRSDVKPSVSFPITDAAGYFTPTIAWRMTDYDLDSNTVTPFSQPAYTIDDRHESRETPIFDIDTGLFFERDGESYTQTLEPRMFYLRVPYRDQTQIPVFDAVQPQFSYLTLFSDNRFYGADRQGDANQLSYALTTRYLDAFTGVQVFEADIGQVRYFADRRVQLDRNTQPDTALYSDVVGDMLYNLNQVWGVDYSQLWNPTTRKTDLASILLQYHPGYQQVVNLGYEFLRPNVKQTTVSYAWPLTGSWSWVGGWNYDVIHHETLEWLWGVEYDSCCWNFQLAHRHFLMPNQKYDNVFFFSLQLKGLGTVGRHLQDLLQRDILGYANDQFSEPLQPEEQPNPE
jgi:LPS-assembly protein